MLHVVALMVFTLNAEPQKDPETATQDLDKLQGRWVVTRYIEAGKSKDPNRTNIRGLVVLFKDEKLSWKTEDELFELTIKLDPKAKPASIDLTSEKGTNHAIYAFIKDELWIAFGTSGLKGNEPTDRPPSFEYQKTDNARAKRVYVFKREKK
jgi:uncharacterized protein (TIGR03067 family)